HLRIVFIARHEHADAPYAVALLRPRHERPSDRRAAEERDEFSTSHDAHLAPMHACRSSYHRDRGKGAGKVAPCSDLCVPWGRHLGPRNPSILVPKLVQDTPIAANPLVSLAHDTIEGTADHIARFEPFSP